MIVHTGEQKKVMVRTWSLNIFTW